MMPKRLSCMAALAAALIGGCSMGAPDPNYVIVTGNPPTPEGFAITLTARAANPAAVDQVIDVSAQAAPTDPPVIPTDTPIPTLAQPPESLLVTADRARVNGFFEDAVGSYQLILVQGESVPEPIRAAAAFGLGVSALREGLFVQAADAMTLFLEQFPNDPRVGQAYFLRGDAYLGQARWIEAINDFSRYLELRPGLLDSYAYERIADGLLAIGQTDAAINNYVNAANAARSLVPQLALRERVAQVEIGAGRTADAVAQYDAILQSAQNAPYRATIALAAAQALLNAGDVENGTIRLQDVVNTYPDQAAAYTAAALLAERGVPVNQWYRGRAAFNYGDYQAAIEAFNTYSTETPAVSIDPDMYLLLGRAYREIGNATAALTAFQTIIDQYRTSPQFGQALLEQGRTRFLSGDIPAAIQFYLGIVDTYDYLPEAPEALWRAAYLYSTNDDPAQARILFERLADRYPESEQARSGLLLAASAALATNDPRAAERFYLEVANRSTGETQSSALLSAGRLALERGDSAAANAAFAQASQAAPDSYFAARSRDILNGTAPFARAAGARFTFDDAAERAEAEAWMRATFGIEQPGELGVLSPELAADRRIVRGGELWAVGAYEEARAEFSDIIDAYRADPLVSYQLALYLRDLTAYQNSIFAAANVIIAAGVGTLDAPRYLARMRYPAYYSDLVQAASERQGVDPLLMLALIRHESLFDTYATAAAGEVGLTQVIPGTGEYIAGQLAFPDYQHADLFRPYAGIEFGAYYLGEQLRTFEGNATAALSGYNAGPGRAIAWRDISGGDHDVFLASITIDSTRIYVQRIYGFYTIYRALYGT
ncbi:MAG: tetratricopeptide repeat protein [bacterium]|nr:tetratricopeptide repeat protein [bacterium]